MPTESRCAANPPPASRRADPAQAVGANAQVLVNARAAGSCTCRYCGTTPRVYSKSHESLAVSSATSLGFSAMETHFRAHKPAFQESLETRLLLPLAIVRSYLLASTPAAPRACSALELCFADVSKCLRRSALMSLLSHLGSAYLPCTPSDNCVGRLCVGPQRKFPGLSRLSEQLKNTQALALRTPCASAGAAFISPRRDAGLQNAGARMPP